MASPAGCENSLVAPTVTVVIPAFNAEAHIGEALTSIAEQSFREFEVIVVDDGSTDGTLQKVSSFAQELDISILRQEHRGPAAARNAGIKRARGRYCAFLDSDDIMLPERLAAQTAILDAGTSVGLVYTDVMTFDENGIIHRSRRTFSEPCSGMVLDQLLLQNFITTSTVMAPKARLIEAGLFPEERQISEDFALWLKMAIRWQVCFVDLPLVQYRNRPGSLSRDKLACAKARLDVLDEFWRSRTLT